MDVVITENKAVEKKNLLKKLAELKLKYKVVISLIVLMLFATTYYGVRVLSLFRVHEELNTDFILVGANYPAKRLLSYEIPPPPELKDKDNPINGNFISRKKLTEMQARKAIAVIFNNHTDARPQYGLSKADIVLEVLAEGGITRYVSIYYENQDLEKIGPVRSVRLYMIEFIQAFDDPVLMHEGQAGYDAAPFETYNPRSDARGYIYKNGINSLQSAASRYRDSERAKTSGYVHSLFTNGDLLKKEIEAYGWVEPSEIEPLKYKFDKPFDQRGNFVSMETTFLGLSASSYRSAFTYDKQTNTYLRVIGGKPDVDALTGERIAPKNVILEWHQYVDARDGHNHLVIDMIGEDDAVILRDGETINGKWKKTCAECRTHYFDDQGNEIELNRGQIWIVNAIKSSSKKVSTVVFK
ncbi:DUF3048 domain-containing protein [Candidatus Dojkabacteria bacterium]|nr:DUF3048 domain-containing protein [Candidatus Dojkabacteria bacterium]